MPRQVMTPRSQNRRMREYKNPKIVICASALAKRSKKPGLVRLPIVKTRGKTLPLAVRRVTVDGKRWKRTKQLDRASNKESVYTLDRETGEIRFGAGIRGARPGAGAVNVTATYRYGAGTSNIVLTYGLDKTARLHLIRVATGNVTVRTDEDECD